MHCGGKDDDAEMQKAADMGDVFSPTKYGGQFFLIDQLYLFLAKL